MSILSNEKVDIKKSEIIFNELIKGKRINELIYDNKTDTLILNPFFSEIRDNYEQYSLQYKMSGMDLVQKPKFFYLIDKNSNNESKQSVKTAKIENTSSILNYLHEKNILWKTNKGGYILSDSGKAMVQDIISNNN